jgi:hypothetical protein
MRCEWFAWHLAGYAESIEHGMGRASQSIRGCSRMAPCASGAGHGESSTSVRGRCASAPRAAVGRC